MKAVRNKILSGMMALVLVVSLLVTTTVDEICEVLYTDVYFEEIYNLYDSVKNEGRCNIDSPDSSG